MGLNLPTHLPEAPPSKDTKKEKVSSATGTDLKSILAAITKEKGNKVVVTGNTIPPVMRQPTGLFELDFHTGGGFPKGRYSIVYGPESSCKTNIALAAVAMAQRNPPPCNVAVWVDVEQTFDPLWARKWGVNTEDLLVVKPSYGEEAVDLIDALIRADDVSILVVDSIAALISSAEIAKSVEKYDVGTSAMLIKRLVNKLTVAFGMEARRDHFPCCILINQRRFKPGVIFGDPEVLPGGETQRFHSSLSLRTHGKNIIDTKTNTSVYKEVNVIVKKAKVPVRGVTFKLEICMSPTDDLQIGETDSFKMVKDYLQQLGLLEKTSKGYWIPEVSGKYWPTLAAIQDHYKADKSFSCQLQDLVNSSMTEMFLVEPKPEGPSYSSPGTLLSVSE